MTLPFPIGGLGGAPGAPSGSSVSSSGPSVPTGAAPKPSSGFQSMPGATRGPVGGKNAVQQNLSSPHSGMRQSIASGDMTARSMGHYGKGMGNNPLRAIRGGTGGMRRIRGGLGPGKMGEPGPASDYSMKSGDTE